MRMMLKIGGNIVFDRAFDGVYIFAHSNAGPVAYAKNMGVDRLCRLAPPHVQHHICGFASHTWQQLQGSARIGHFAVEIIHQKAAHLDNVLGFLAEQSDGFDVFQQGLFAQIKHLLRGVSHGKQRPRRLVYACISGLCRQGHRDYQSIDIHMFQLALWFGLAVAKARENLADGVIIQLLCHAASYALFHRFEQGPQPMRNIRVAKWCIAAYFGNMKNHDRTYHYHIMARAIAAIDAAPTPLSLDQLAAEIGLSAAHFQRLFSTWAGVSPKRFQQYLTLGHAKTLLSSRFTTLETAHNTGLSGSGRLHDLFLKWEAMSPGDYAKGGAGLVINYGWFDSPFGDALVMGTTRGLCGMAFADEQGRDVAWADMTSRWPKATFVENTEALQGWTSAAFAQQGTTALHMIGAPFQIKVWEALLRIPSGNVTTYSEIATSIGTPNAQRAVGTAVGRNPVSWLIPCHRALRKSGGLGGYHWGLPIKRAMLAYESARVEA